MKSSHLAAIAALATALSASALAQTNATGTLAESGFSGGLYDYTLTLHNTGSTAIETFWYAWIPGQNYMATRPTNITEGAAWNAPLVSGSGNATDGYAIRWESATGLAAGDSATFNFWSASTPTELAGDSLYHGNPPVGTSTVYSGIFPSGSSARFVVQSVPTPPSIVVLGLGMVGLILRRKRRA